MNKRWTEKAIYVIVTKMQFWTRNFCAKLPSASSWGCELKYVSFLLLLNLPSSASSWGCELKYSCFVCPDDLSTSASSWGCELKWVFRRSGCEHRRQPLREAVSWNVPNGVGTDQGPVSLFVRLWVEIIIFQTLAIFSFVSLFVRLWVEISKLRSIRQSALSASSWGCELKCVTHLRPLHP